MTEQEIREAAPEQLRTMVAEVLGWQRVGPVWKVPGLPVYRELPEWPGDIGAAWELDGEEWLWEFYESDVDLEVVIEAPKPTLFIGFIRHAELCRISESWRETKAQTYATARTRAWLLAIAKTFGVEGERQNE